MVYSSHSLSSSLSPSPFAHHLHLHKSRLIRISDFIQARPFLGFDRSSPLPPPITWNNRTNSCSLVKASGNGHESMGAKTQKNATEKQSPVRSFEESVMENGNVNASEVVKGSSEGNRDETVKEGEGKGEEESIGEIEETEELSMKKTEIRIGRFSFSQRDMKIAAGAAVVVVFSVANRLLYKMALIPMKEYPFFLALFNTFGYVIVYFSFLYVRYRAHIVTDEMLKLPKWRFILVGFLEALGVASGMAAGAVLPGASLPILVQTFLIWQLVFSAIFLKRRYSLFQIIGCSLVLVGVILALTSTTTGMTLSTDQIQWFWPFLMILSASFQAAASIIKEFVFRDAEKRLEGGSVDIFVVNSFGSAFQSLFVFLLLPFLSQIRGIPPNKLLSYASDGAGCLFNIGSYSTECNSATLLTFGYIAVNLGFNISLLSLLKNSSAVVTSLCTTLAVPLSIYMFTLPLPFVGTPSTLPPQFLLGTTILICGLAFYNFADRLKKLKAE